MKDFPKTKQFADDMNLLGRIIFTKEFFFRKSFFYERAKKISEKYADFDERTLTKELIDNTEVQSTQGLQDAFDIWKTLLNNINVPNSDLLSYYDNFNKFGDREEEGREMLELVMNLCGAVRREVQNIIENRKLKNNCVKRDFLTPHFYESGDIGFEWADSPGDGSQSNPTVLFDIDFTDKHKFSPKEILPLKPLYKFLINKDVISDNVDETYFMNCILHAYLKGLRIRSKKKTKIQRTFDYLGQKYFPDKETDKDGTAWDYREVAASELYHKDGTPWVKGDLSKGQIKDDFMERLKEVI